MQPVQSNARGAAFIAAVGLGYIDFEDIPNLMKYGPTYEPDQQNRVLYDNLFSEFTNIYKRNKSMFQRINKSNADKGSQGEHQ